MLRIGFDDSLVPERLLVPPEKLAPIDIKSGVLGPLYDESLVRFGRLEAANQRELAGILRQLRDGDAMPALGFARFADYVREALGISPRWAQELGCTTEELVAQREALVPLGRFGRPEELGRVVAFLASDVWCLNASTIAT